MAIRAEQPEEPAPQLPPPGLPAPLSDPEVFPSPPDPIPTPDSTPIEAPVDPMELLGVAHRSTRRALPSFVAWADAMQRGDIMATRTSRPSRESCCASRSAACSG